MRRPDQFRQHVKKNGKGTFPSEGWTIIEAERHTRANHVRTRLARRNRMLLWALRLVIALLVLVSMTPYLSQEDLIARLGVIANYRVVAPVDSGDRNGLLHK
jgi:hypothetical protein